MLESRGRPHERERPEVRRGYRRVLSLKCVFKLATGRCLDSAEEWVALPTDFNRALQPTSFFNSTSTALQPSTRSAGFPLRAVWEISRYDT